jgi:hypothetical protein
MVTMVRERQVDCHRNGIKIEIPPRRCRRGRPESSRDVPSVLRSNAPSVKPREIHLALAIASMEPWDVNAGS